MTIPVIGVPDISIPHIPVQVIEPVKIFGDYVVHPVFNEPSLMLPGCYKTHRDADKNSNLINDDPRGFFWSCPWGEVPEIVPLQFDRSKMIYSNDVKEKKKTEEPVILKETKETKIPERKEKKVFFPPCPDPNSKLRVGSFANEKRLERIKEFRYNESKTECLTIWEDVEYVDQWLPEPTLVINTIIIASIAATSPVLVNIIKGLTKNIVKKITSSRKKKNDNASQSD
tara:strand:- start:591 stop:1274 length:684 start_codon:yes stop_codon:yes gene_type:complete